jgi:hypothetical protein
MKLPYVLLAVGCWLSAVSAQWLETTIYMTIGLTQQEWSAERTYMRIAVG